MKVLYALILVLGTVLGAAAAPRAQPPNVVFILADDLGYGDLGRTGHPYARTPALDRLADEGTLFTRFYTAGATCCPGRTGLMTGRFPATFAKYPAAYGFSGATTVTDLLKKSGYRTGHFGKWHIGPEEEPGTYGIDVVRVLGGNRRDPRGRDADIADAAIDFLRASKGAPFYVNIWFHTAHAPIAPPRSFVDLFAAVTVDRNDFANPDMRRYFDLYASLGGDLDQGMRNYLGDVLQLDGQVNRVLAAIDELGLRDNTLVVFTSDNGPADATVGNEERKRTPDGRLQENLLGSAGPFRERKHSLYDGGIHVPFIVRWPKHVPAGRVDDASVIAGVDWLPSLCAIAGIAPDGAGLDGEDVSEVWRGHARARTKDLFWKASNPNDTPVLLRGDRKLHLPRRGAAELYELAKDPGERENVADQNPQMVRELRNALARWNASLPTSYEK